MTKIFNKIFLKNQFIAFAFLIVLVIISLTLYYSFSIKSKYESKIISQLSIESSALSFDLSSSVKHTEYMMNVIASQIKNNPTDKEYINNIISKFRVNPLVENLLAWTIFSWSDEDYQIIVDALYGIMEKPFDLSIRDYIGFTKTNPSKIQIGKPIYGSTSKRWMIPAGVGAVGNDGQFIGSVTVGFDIETIKESFRGKANNSNIQFALIDSKHNIIFKSSNNTSLLNEEKISNYSLINHIKTLDRTNNLISASEINIFNDNLKYLLRKVDDLPFYIFVSYDQTQISQELWEALFSRLLEISVISVVFFFLLFVIYLRIVRPLVNLSKIANNIASGNLDQVITKETSYETRNLSIQLKRFIKLIKKERKTQNQLSRAIEEGNESDKAREEFTKKIREDLKHPLNAISAIIEVLTLKNLGKLKADISKEEEIEYLKIAYKALGQLQSLTSDNYSFEKINTSELLNDSIIIESKLISNNELKISSNVPNNLPNMYSDAIKFQQIFTGLLTRSIDFCQKGSTISVEASIVENEPEDKFLKVTISDNGLGFDNFTREKWYKDKGAHKLDSAYNSTYISIADIEKIIAALGGKICYEDVVGKGSKVEVILPYIDIEEDNVDDNIKLENVVKLFE